MHWFEIKVPVHPEIMDAVGNHLFELGASGTQERDNEVIAYFENMESSTVVSQIREYLGSLAELGLPANPDDDRITVTGIADQDWNAEWKKQFVPFLVSPAVMIKPTWCELPPEHPETVIELDPEMAFGTGTHATTALCALLLEKQASGKTILDAGTGTGILAMIALKLGAAACYGFDIDPLATDTARNNAVKNHIRSLFLYTGETNALKTGEFDMITANINSGQILAILKDFRDLLKYQGTLILSGILDSEEEKLSRALLEHDFEILQVLHREEWLAFECKKSK